MRKWDWRRGRRRGRRGPAKAEGGVAAAAAAACGDRILGKVATR